MPIDVSMIGLQGQQAYADRMQTLAQADLMRANAQEQQMKNMQEQQLQALNAEATQKVNAILTQTGGADSPDPSDIAAHMNSLADPIEAVAGVYLKGGAIERGLELVKAAGDIRSKESNIQKDQADIQKGRLENLLKGTELVGKEIGNAQNESEYKLGLANIRKAVESGALMMPPEQLAQLENTRYSPDVVDYFRNKAISIADQTRLQIQQHNSDRSDATAQDQARARATQLALSQARLEETNRHNTVMEKVAGNKGSLVASKAPDSNTIKSVMSNLQATVFRGQKVDAKDPTVLAAADYVASTAQAMIKDNRGIDWNTAVNRAIVQAQQSGAFETVKGHKGSWPWSDDVPDKTTFKRKPGMVPDDALSPPVDSNGKVVPTKLVKGRYYKLPDGRVGKYTGTGISVVQP